LRYYTAAAFYGVFALALYSALIGFPDLLQHVLQAGSDALVPDWAKHLSSPLMVALILTVLLPNAPILSGVDESIRQLFLSMASIPLEVSSSARACSGRGSLSGRHSRARSPPD